MSKKYLIIIAALIAISVMGALALVKEKNCQRELIFTLLNRELQRASDDFYSEYLSELPFVSNYCGQVASIQKEDKGYTVRIMIQPYIGPHFPVGDDEADYFVDNLGTLTLTGYYHRRNYELPERLGVMIKKPIPIS